MDPIQPELVEGSGRRIDVLHTGERSHAAVLRLEPGASTGDKPGVNPSRDQILLVVEGVIEAEVDGARSLLRRGDSVEVPTGTAYRLTNRGSGAAVTFHVYAPPLYLN